MFSRQRAAILQHRRHRAEMLPCSRHHVERDALLGELADRDGRTVDRQRRDDDVDAAAVEQARVADRARFVDAPADPA